MEKQVQYKFSRMELAQFATFDEAYSPDVKEVKFQTNAQFSFDKEHNIICSSITVIVSAQSSTLIKAELRSYFDLLPESIETLREDQSIVFPPEVLIQFASLCYGSMRGVLFAKTIGSPLADFILPPVFFNSIITSGFSVPV